MKILLMGDASNYHASLAKGLAQIGHDVTVASNGSRWMQTTRGIDISRKPGRIAGALLWLRLNTVLASDLKGYDIVHICGPNFVEQRPKRIISLFDRLRRDNGHVFMTMLGTDSRYVDICVNAPVLRYSEWSVGRTPTPFAKANEAVRDSYLGDELMSLTDYVYDRVEGVVTALYEYHRVCEQFVDAGNLAYGGIPVEVSDECHVPDGKSALDIMAACHRGREAEKGVDLMLTVLRRFVDANPEYRHLDLVQNVPFAEFSMRLDSADIVVNQLYSYTPATSALMAMAKGKIVISGAEQEYYDFIGESELRPIINADPTNLGILTEQLEALVADPESMMHMRADARRFVVKHNSQNVVARRFDDFWMKKIG